MDISQQSELDIKKIVQFGSRVPEDYKILFYNEVYGKEMVVKIRGLSNYEYDEISLRMYEHLNDAATINYVFNKPKQKNGEDEEIPSDVNVAHLTLAYTVRDVYIVYYAMKDYYKNLTIDSVKQLEGIDEIADRINFKSGRTAEVAEKIKFFREERRKSKSEVSIK